MAKKLLPSILSVCKITLLFATLLLTFSASAQSNCSGVSANASGTQLTITGINAPNKIVRIYDSNWNVIYSCNADCTSEITRNLPAGTYHVEVQFYDHRWNHTCRSRLQVNLVETHPQPCICPRIFAPVCGEDGNTYDNSCVAECAGVRVVSQGECRTSSPCPAIFRPVCGEDGNTYDNECLAGLAGVRVVSQGECQAANNCDFTVTSQECGKITVELNRNEAPSRINFQNTSTGQRYVRDCSSRNCAKSTTVEIPAGHYRVEVLDRHGNQCGNSKTVSVGECSSNSNCACPRIFAPVCGEDGNTYDNSCVAECAGVRVVSQGECRTSSPCPAIFRPVCGEDGNTYDNECLAGLAGVRVVSQGECQTSTPCPAIFRPVCGEDGNTYDNECLAGLAGVRVVSQGECQAANNCDFTVTSQECGKITVELNRNEAPSRINFQNTSTGQRYVRDCNSRHCAKSTTVEIPAGHYRVEVLDRHGNRCGNSKTVSVGECSSNSNCACPRIFAPVCGEDGNTYDNSCVAECAGIRVVSQGECQTNTPCPAIFRPVCGEDGNTYDNECLAGLAGVRVVSQGECRAANNCDFTVTSGECGKITVELNHNEAPSRIHFQNTSTGQRYVRDCSSRHCAKSTTVEIPAGHYRVEVLDRHGNQCGYSKTVSVGECSSNSNCACPAIFDPVCGADGQTYDNACVAACAGVRVVSQGSCGSSNGGKSTTTCGDAHVEYGDGKFLFIGKSHRDYSVIVYRENGYNHYTGETNWVPLYSCTNNCGNRHELTNMSSGKYWFETFDRHGNRTCSIYYTNYPSASGRSARIVTEAVTTFPNPAQEEVFFNLEKFEGKSVDIQITNSLGQIVGTQFVEEASAEPVRMTLNGYQNGLYYYTIKADKSGISTGKFMVSKLY